MKFISSKQLQKGEFKEHGRVGKYLITLEVTDTDIDMFEDIVTTYTPFERVEEPSKKNDYNGVYSADFNKKYRKWLNRTWNCFCKLWKLYD